MEIHTLNKGDLSRRLPQLEGYLAERAPLPLSWHPGWLLVLERALGHTPYCLEATKGGRAHGFLALAYVRSLLFGRFLVSLPYLNYGGPVAGDEATALSLVGRAVELAKRLNVRYLELRGEKAADHPALVRPEQDKVHMQLDLPDTSEELWKKLSPKVRNQVRKGQKSDLAVAWGKQDLLSEFYAVFSKNMRDLGTPVYSKALFRSMVEQFPDRVEFCVIRLGEQAVASAVLLHGWGVTEVPSASSLREYNSTCANMLLYWHLRERAIKRKQAAFDFGRSSPDSSTFRFKKQWDAQPKPAAWQYYLLQGQTSDMRPSNPKYQRFIRLWQRLPVGLTRMVGPWIVRGIP